MNQGGTADKAFLFVLDRRYLSVRGVFLFPSSPCTKDRQNVLGGGRIPVHRLKPWRHRSPKRDHHRPFFHYKCCPPEYGYSLRYRFRHLNAGTGGENVRTCRRSYRRFRHCENYRGARERGSTLCGRICEKDDGWDEKISADQPVA